MSQPDGDGQEGIGDPEGVDQQEGLLPYLGAQPLYETQDGLGLGRPEVAVLLEPAPVGRLRPGDLVLPTAVGAGLAWASAILRWGRVDVTARTRDRGADRPRNRPSSRRPD